MRVVDEVIGLRRVLSSAATRRPARRGSQCCANRLGTSVARTPIGFCGLSSEENRPNYPPFFVLQPLCSNGTSHVHSHTYTHLGWGAIS